MRIRLFYKFLFLFLSLKLCRPWKVKNYLMLISCRVRSFKGRSSWPCSSTEKEIISNLSSRTIVKDIKTIRSEKLDSSFRSAPLRKTNNCCESNEYQTPLLKPDNFVLTKGGGLIILSRKAFTLYQKEMLNFNQ